jgi:LmbE family N-acetylglucosaminyl deacetylase
MNVVGIGANPDDVEIGASGTLSRHAQEGDNVYILHMINSGYSDPIGGKTYRTSEEVMKNAYRAAEIIGAELHTLNYNDRKVPFNEDSVIKVDRFLREHSINIIYTHWRGDAHQDHINTHNTVMAAGRYVDNIYLFEQIPLPRASTINAEARYYVDITDYFDMKTESISAYESEVKKYGNDLLEGIEALARYRGIQCGCKYAEAFEVVKEVRRIGQKFSDASSITIKKK